VKVRRTAGGVRGAARRRVLRTFLGLAFALSACQSTTPLRRLPEGDPRPDALLARFAADTAGREGLRGVARLAVDADGQGPGGGALRVRSKQRIVLARPARLRVEVQGLFGTTLAMLTVDDEQYAWFESESRRFESGPVHDGLLWQVVRLDLTPAEAVEVILGAPPTGPELSVLGAWDAGEGVTRIALGEPGGAPRRSIDLDPEARLVHLALHGADGEPLWEAHFDDYVRVAGSPLARRIRIETGEGTQATVSLSGVELNPPLVPDIFRLERSLAGSDGEGG